MYWNRITGTSRARGGEQMRNFHVCDGEKDESCRKRKEKGRQDEGRGMVISYLVSFLTEEIKDLV